MIRAKNTTTHAPLPLPDLTPAEREALLNRQARLTPRLAGTATPLDAIYANPRKAPAAASAELAVAARRALLVAHRTAPQD